MADPMPFAVLQVVTFAMACCIGSFFNVVIHRLPNRESIVRPGSRCPTCMHPIAFYDNIPLLGFAWLRGRCRHCHARISWRYPAVEALTGGLAVVLLRIHGLHPQFLIEFFLVGLLILIAFIDLDTFIIPDILSLGGLVAGLALSLVSNRVTWIGSLVGALVGGGFLLLIALAYHRVRHQEGLGIGDVKLLGMIGAFVGWEGVIFTTLAASVVGTLVGLVVMRRRREGLTTMLPFGPFLSFGAVCYLLVGESFFDWYIGLFSD